MSLYFKVYEYDDETKKGKRRIYTFDNEHSANEMVEMILRNDPFKPLIGIEEYETPAKL